MGVGRGFRSWGWGVSYLAGKEGGRRGGNLPVNEIIDCVTDVTRSDVLDTAGRRMVGVAGDTGEDENWTHEGTGEMF
jgi:hypothetical protein